MDQDLKWSIERQIPHLRRYAIALTRDRDRADDLVQDTLERALLKRHLFQRKGRLRGWLFRILYRTFVDKKRRVVPHMVAADESVLDGAASQPASQEDHVEYRNIAAALEQLPEEQRSIILLVALEGMQYDEIADILDLPIGTVRSRLSRGREALRSMRSFHDRPVRLRRVK
ncbi:MAG: sigma-70 family RNA polymerase sigma factor [Methyloligella sp. ZOD6]